MSRRDYLGCILVDKPHRKRVWAGNGRLIPLAARMEVMPPLWGDPEDARKAARALRRVLGLRLVPVACWSP